MSMRAVNPATGELIREYPTLTTRQATAAVETAQSAFSGWRDLPLPERAECLRRTGAILRERKREYGRLLSLEMGKPITQSVAEVEKSAWVCEYYAESAAAMLEREVIASSARESYVRFDPLGVILAVMPWNFPFWQVFRFAAPVLASGNVCLLKHASNVPGSALAIQDVFLAAGCPVGVFQTLLIDARCARNLLGHASVRGVSLTGSEPAGRSIAALAGKQLKKVVLELGGSDPFVVFPDCELEQTLSMAVASRLFNTGQSCISAKRFILVGEVAERFTPRLVELFSVLKVGDPLEESTDVGPLAREEFVADLERQVGQSVDHGARVLCGGKRADRPGFYYLPTVLDRVGKGMPAYEEEVFGPVAALIRVADEEEAVAVANDTSFGLGASLWTRDLEKAKRLAGRIESGMVYINSQVKSDPRLPFGGIKNSGFGRELSHHGIREFVNIKTVYLG